MRSRQLETALTRFIEEAASRLQGDLDAGAEVPFELDSRSARGHRAALYCYRPLTPDFIAQRWPELRRLPSHAAAVALLGAFDGLHRYLLGRGGNASAAAPAHRASAHQASGARAADGALRVLLQDVFAEHSDFRLAQDDERLQATLQRLDGFAHSSPTEVTLLATLHGLAIASPELPLAPGLTLVRPDEVDGVPDGALHPGQPDGSHSNGHLLVACRHEDPDPGQAIVAARDRLTQLLRALRLFGDGRLAFGALAWARLGDGAWNPLALGHGGRPHGMLLVGADHEDELRAFCNLIARRAPRDGELAWALRRYELACDRPTEYDALSDHLLALRALLEPDGDRHQGLLPRRLAALCAAPGERRAMTRAVEQALALERAVVAGTAIVNDHGDEQVRQLAGHLRALLRDVICGHLDRDLVGVADEILAAPGEPATEEAAVVGVG